MIGPRRVVSIQGRRPSPRYPLRVPLLDCRGLARSPFFAARDLTLAEGEIVFLSGPSGSGKSLFLRTIADLDPADAGRVTLRGEPRASIAPAAWRARVLYVHQGGVRFPGTVRENLDRVAALEGSGARRRGRFPAVPDVEDEKDVERLSGGEAQALALHRALCLEPEVLLLDEATSAMDPERAAFWEGRVRDWVGAARAALWVAHDVAIAARLGARRERFP